MNKTLISCCTIVVISVMCVITYSAQNKFYIEKEFVKSGLEQCRTGRMEPLVWVKNCQDYIKARNCINGEK